MLTHRILELGSISLMWEELTDSKSDAGVFCSGETYRQCSRARRVGAKLNSHPQHRVDNIGYCFDPTTFFFLHCGHLVACKIL